MIDRLLPFCFRYLAFAISLCTLLAISALYDLQAQSVERYDRPNQRLNTKGDDFYFAYMDNSVGEEPSLDTNQVILPPRLWIHISAPDAPANVKIIYPRPEKDRREEGYDPRVVRYVEETHQLTQNEVKAIRIPNLIAEFLHTVDAEWIQKNAIRVTSDVPINCYIANDAGFSHDMSIVYPVSNWRSKYTVMAYDENADWLSGLNIGKDFFKSELIIVAKDDNTLVRITPSNNTIKFPRSTRYPRWRSNRSLGIRQGVQTLVELNAGETYMLQSLGDLTGTIIEVLDKETRETNACKVVAVFAGNQCTSVGNRPTCDHIFEQNLPDSSQSSDYVLVGTASRDVDLFRIMALEDNTIVRFLNPPTGIPIDRPLNAGKYFDFQVPTVSQNRAYYVYGVDATDQTKRKPLSVAYFIASDNADGDRNNADPSMFILGANRFMFSRTAAFIIPKLDPRTLGGQTQDNFYNYANVIVRTKYEGNVTMNGQLLLQRTVVGNRPGGTDTMRIIRTPADPANKIESYTVFAIPFATSEIGQVFKLSVDAPPDSVDAGIIIYNYGLSLDDSYGYTSSVGFIASGTFEHRLVGAVDIACSDDSTGSIEILVRGGRTRWRPNVPGSTPEIPITLPDGSIEPPNGEPDTVWFYKEYSWYKVEPNPTDPTGNITTLLPAPKNWDPLRPNRASNLGPGNYLVKIVDHNNCRAEYEATILAPIDPIVKLEDVICRNQTEYRIPTGKMREDTSNVIVNDSLKPVEDYIWCPVDEPGRTTVPVTPEGVVDLTNIRLDTTINTFKIQLVTREFAHKDKTTPLNCDQNIYCRETLTVNVRDVHESLIYMPNDSCLDVSDFLMQFGGRYVMKEKIFNPDNMRFKWEFPEINQTSEEQNPAIRYPNRDGLYTVKLAVTELPYMCESTAERTFDIVRCYPYNITFFNVFSPNGDGATDRFEIEHRGITSALMRIYDRWGIEVYADDPMTNPWNGLLPNGQKAMEGQYFWVFTGYTITNLRIERSGGVTLIR